ncbi:uncharacterized protein LOC123871479 [Maniola jurtina]|uniref:uncharacterized protein LOC123871479 n=1 Tax=Maniola jurtina TaxID=191418 RepID=UPI001E685CE9|nr:uncharacterized protein LOC123871479 [Maniola jurtina]
MLMCLGRCNCNYAEARRLYEELFAIPRNVTLPSTMAFQRLHIRMYNTGSVHGRDQHRADAGRPRIHDGDIEEQILDMFGEDPTRSTRSVGRELGVNHMRVWRILKDDGQHPFHYRRVQSLLPTDYEPRMVYSRWVLDKVEEDREFLSHVLFTDECSFVRTGVFNSHNEHVWSVINPHATKPSHFQHRWRINVWAGIIGDKIIGPCFLTQTMNGGNYLRFLREELSEELDELNLNLVRRLWFQHDGAPPHFSRPVRDYLNAEYGERWIGRGGPVNWPARSPDLTPLDFFLWGTVEQSVFKKPATPRPKCV